jgi:hypothetical protein
MIMFPITGHFLVNKDAPDSALSTIDAFIKQVDAREKLDQEAKEKEAKEVDYPHQSTHHHSSSFTV